MTPAVRAARLWRKLDTAFGIVVMSTGVLVFCATIGALIHQSWKAIEGEREFESRLTAASKKSEAHTFLVSHWLQCSPLRETNASCYAAIRTAAGSRGELFVTQVDLAARELKLI